MATHLRQTLRTLPVWRRSSFWLVILGCLIVAAIWTPEARGHASLERAEPPVDGLVIAAPSRLQLFFTEEVATANPAPSIQVLDESGQAQEVSDIKVGDAGDPRVVTALVDGLDNGTYTVAWSVRSTTDGHILSGSYAFRIGGGIPPGSAVTDGGWPAPWAVATRWLTFGGIAMAAAGFLFGQAVLGGREESGAFAHRRDRVIMIGSVTALAATLSEPILQVFYPPQDIELTLGSSLSGLPSAWWFRPICLGIVAFFSLFLIAPLSPRVPSAAYRLGGGVSLLALAGLSLTSHAAGRRTWREAAVLVDFLHQASTALWVGGLIVLAVWWPFRHTMIRDEALSALLSRFSQIALVLLAVALATGAVNTGFVFPLADGISEYGFSVDAASTLWTTGYGLVLLAKLAVLLIPLSLAFYHRQIISRAADVASTARDLLTKFGRTIRLEAIAVLIVVLGGSVMALSSPPRITSAPLETVNLTVPAYTAEGEMSAVLHLTIDPAVPGDNDLTLSVTTPEGESLPTDPEIRFALEFKSLDHGTVSYDQNLPLLDAATATYGTTGLRFSLDGWWGLTVTIRRQGFVDSTAQTFLLLPDPNTQGFDAPPAPETSDDAQAVFDRGLNSMTSWTSVRLTERIATGTGAVVLFERAITTGSNGDLPAQEVIGIYSGAFGGTATGEPPAPPSLRFTHTVTIGERGWQRTPEGDWLETPPGRAQPPSEWGSIYSGAEHIRLGATDELNGETVQIISFHTPDRIGQSEAWFTWWVGQDSGTVHRVTMVANQHYMVTDYGAINEPFTIEGPPSGG